MKKALVGCGAVLYLSFGVWFGSLSYKVNTYPDNYDYSVQLVFFPLTTLINNDWFCIEDSNQRICRVPAPSQKINLSLLLSNPEHSADNRIPYISMLACFWPLKIVANLLLILFVYVFATLCLSSLTITVFVFIIFDLIVSGLLWLL